MESCTEEERTAMTTTLSRIIYYGDPVHPNSVVSLNLHESVH